MAASTDGRLTHALCRFKILSNQVPCYCLHASGHAHLVPIIVTISCSIVSTGSVDLCIFKMSFVPLSSMFITTGLQVCFHEVPMMSLRKMFHACLESLLHMSSFPISHNPNSISIHGDPTVAVSIPIGISIPNGKKTFRVGVKSLLAGSCCRSNRKY